MRQKKSAFPKQRRTIPLSASDRNSGREKIDAGRYFRCWNCGFICDIEKNALSDEGNGSHPMAYANVAEGAYGGYGSYKITVDGDTMQALDSNGDPVGITHNFQADGTGCPLCFTRAWKK